MTYQVRNNIVLALLVGVVLLVSSYLNLFHFPRRLEKVRSDIKSLQQNINALEGIENEFYLLEQTIVKQEKKLKNLDKRIAPAVTPAETYRYLDNILSLSGRIDFNLYFVEQKIADGYRYNVFRLKGEGYYGRVFSFISFLEKGPEVYKIDKVRLTMQEDKDPDTGRLQILVPFDMEIWALSADVEDLPPIQRTLDDVRIARVSNPFYPHIVGFIPPNTRGLLDVTRSELKALLPDRALVADQTGKIRVLHEGDEVYLGYLSKILPNQNRAEFVLNKGGIVEKVSLELRFDKLIN